MNPSLLAMLAVVIGGAATALQAPTNAKMMGAVGSPVNAAFVSFAVGTAALGLLALLAIGGLYGGALVAGRRKAAHD